MSIYYYPKADMEQTKELANTPPSAYTKVLCVSVYLVS